MKHIEDKLMLRKVGKHQWESIISRHYIDCLGKDYFSEVTWGNYSTEHIAQRNSIKDIPAMQNCGYKINNL